jgi:hypothetical protein
MSGFQVLERYYPIGIPIIVFSGSSRGADPADRQLAME